MTDKNQVKNQKGFIEGQEDSQDKSFSHEAAEGVRALNDKFKAKFSTQNKQYQQQSQMDMATNKKTERNIGKMGYKKSDKEIIDDAIDRAEGKQKSSTNQNNQRKQSNQTNKYI